MSLCARSGSYQHTDAWRTRRRFTGNYNSLSKSLPPADQPIELGFQDARPQEDAPAHPRPLIRFHKIEPCCELSQYQWLRLLNENFVPRSISLRTPLCKFTVKNSGHYQFARCPSTGEVLRSRLLSISANGCWPSRRLMVLLGCDYETLSLYRLLLKRPENYSLAGTKRFPPQPVSWRIETPGFTNSSAG